MQIFIMTSIQCNITKEIVNIDFYDTFLVKVSKVFTRTLTLSDANSDYIVLSYCLLSYVLIKHES